MNGYCTACHKAVIWAFTVNRKRIALDPEPDAKGNQAAYRDHRPAWLTRQLGGDQEPFGWERRYMPHVATCTGPQQRREPRSPAPLPANVIPISRARRR